MNKLSSLVRYLKGRALSADEPMDLKPLIREKSIAAGIFLGLTLVALVIIPALVNGYSARLHNRGLDLIAPLNRAVDNAQHALSEMDNDHKDYILSGRKEFIIDFPAHMSELNLALAEANKLATQIDETAPQLIENFRLKSSLWVTRYALPIQSAIEKGAPTDQIRPLVESGKSLLDSVRFSSNEIRIFLARDRTVIQEKISTFAKISVLASVILGLFALLGSGYLFRVGRLTGNLYVKALNAYQNAIRKSLTLESQLSFSETLLKHTPLGIAVIDFARRLKYGSRTFEHLPFIKNSEGLDRKLTDVLEKSDATRTFLTVIDLILNDRKGFQRIDDVRFDPREGSPTYWTFRAIPFGENGRDPDQILLVWADVTAEKTAFHQIEEQHRKAQKAASESSAIVDNMGDGLIAVNENNDIRCINTQARKLLGISDELRLPQPLSILGDALFRALDVHSVKVPTENKGSTRLSLFPASSGQLVETIATPILAPHEGKYKVVSVIGVLHDITEQKKSEREKDDFLALASHELKTPLTVLDTSCQIISKAIQTRDISRIEAANVHLLSQLRRLKLLILQLFDFSNLESARMRLRTEKMELGKLVRRIVDEQKIVSPDRNFELILPTTPLIILIDPPRVEQILNNLISNSVRYSPSQSKITVSVETTGSNAVICISDQGIGIAKEDISKIFRRFGRGSNVGNVSGMGIGLYVSAELARAHGGRIWAESEGLNMGSKFCFELPIVNAQSQKAA